MHGIKRDKCCSMNLHMHALCPCFWWEMAWIALYSIAECLNCSAVCSFSICKDTKTLFSFLLALLSLSVSVVSSLRQGFPLLCVYSNKHGRASSCMESPDITVTQNAGKIIASSFFLLCFFLLGCLWLILWWNKKATFKYCKLEVFVRECVIAYTVRNSKCVTLPLLKKTLISFSDVLRTARGLWCSKAPW